MYVYETCCVHSTAFSIDRMVDRAEEITYQTFRRTVGGESLDEFAASWGYDVGHERGGLRLCNDWHVTYHKSHYRGKPCYYLCHSGNRIYLGESMTGQVSFVDRFGERFIVRTDDDVNRKLAEHNLPETDSLLLITTTEDGIDNRFWTSWESCLVDRLPQLGVNRQKVFQILEKSMGIEKDSVGMAWADRFGISYVQYHTLLKKVTHAVDMQELAHNYDDDGYQKQADRACSAVGSYARKLGLGTDWRPGLYPHFVKGELNQPLPD